MQKIPQGEQKKQKYVIIESNFWVKFKLEIND